MIKLLKSIVILVLNYFSSSRKLSKSKVYNIIKEPEETFEKICCVKRESWDKSYYAALYGHCKEQSLEIFHPTQYALLINNAIINCDSDVIITDKGAYWDKYNEEEFLTWAKPADTNVIKYTNDKVWILPERNTAYIPGISLSLAGLWSYHWAHYLFQFSSKLYYAGEQGLLKDNVTVLFNDRGDLSIKQCIVDYLKLFPNVKLRSIEGNIDYICETLISIPSTSPNFNDYQFRLDYPCIIPDTVMNNIFKYIRKPYIEKVKDRAPKYEKIFLPRGSFRNLTNYEEIHEYFKGLGFVDIEGSELTLEEKAYIFYHAKEIVLPQGTSSQNFIFCNGAKCLVMTNYRMSVETALYSMARPYIKTWINVSGQDDNSSYHSNYTIPLNKVIKAYEEYIKQK